MQKLALLGFGSTAEEQLQSVIEVKARDYHGAVRNALATLQELSPGPFGLTEQQELQKTLQELHSSLLVNLNTIKAEDRNKILSKIQQSGPSFRNPVPIEPSTPAAASESFADAQTLYHFPLVPSLEQQEAFTSAKLTVDTTNFRWLEQNDSKGGGAEDGTHTDAEQSGHDSIEPASWFTALLRVMEALLILRWAENENEQPHETKRVQPVLSTILGVAGKVFGFTVRIATSTNLVLTNTAGSVFPEGQNFVGATDLVMEWANRLVCLVEVKVVFDRSKYFVQAVAQGFAAVAGLNTDDWNLHQAFQRQPLAVPRVLLWNGCRAACIRVDSLTQCTADSRPMEASSVLWKLLCSLHAEQRRGGNPSPPFAPPKHRPRGNGDGADGDGSGDGASGPGGRSHKKSSSSTITKQLSFSAAQSSDGPQHSSSASQRPALRSLHVNTAGRGVSSMATAKPSRIAVAALTESNLDRWESGGYRGDWLL